MITIITFGLGLVFGMYVSSLTETHIENGINPKMKMSKKELGIEMDRQADKEAEIIKK